MITLKRLKRTPSILLLGALILSGCSFFQDEELADTSNTYETKLLEYSVYVDQEGTQLEPRETKVYDDSGKMTGRFVNTYEAFAAGKPYVLKRTDVYTLSTDGIEKFLQYYEYDYIEDTYTDFDEEGLPITIAVYLVSEGRSYIPATENPLTNPGTLYHDYVVTYNTTFPNQAGRYTSIIDRSYETGSPVTIAEQISTYKLVYDGTDFDVYDYTTEKFYQKNRVTNADGSQNWSGTLDLTKEYAAWYNTDGQWTHELYHVIRTDDTATNPTEEIYYLTKYEWGTLDHPYKQQDFIFDKTGLPILADKSFGVGVPDGFTIPFTNIGAMEEEVFFTYDDLGNLILREAYYQGSEVDKKAYRYNSNSEQTSMINYTNGQSFPFERIETRYFDGTYFGNYSRIKEEYNYKTNLNARSMTNSTNVPRVFEVATRGIIDPTRYRPIRSNHAR